MIFINLKIIIIKNSRMSLISLQLLIYLIIHFDVDFLRTFYYNLE